MKKINFFVIAILGMALTIVGCGDKPTPEPTPTPTPEVEPHVTSIEFVEDSFLSFKGDDGRNGTVLSTKYKVTIEGSFNGGLIEKEMDISFRDSIYMEEALPKSAEEILQLMTTVTTTDAPSQFNEEGFAVEEWVTGDIFIHTWVKDEEAIVSFAGEDVIIPAPHKLTINSLYRIGWNHYDFGADGHLFEMWYRFNYELEGVFEAKDAQIIIMPIYR